MDKTHLAQLVFLAGAILGQVMFWLKRWAQDEKPIMGYVKRTVAAVIGNFTGVVTILVSGALGTMSPEAAFSYGIFLGISADSVLNRGERKEWPDVKREDEKRQQTVQTVEGTTSNTKGATQ